MKIEDLLGAIVQGGMSQSSSSRMKNSVSGGGLLESLAGMLGGGAAESTQAAPSGSGGGGLLGGLGDILGGALGGGSQPAQPSSAGGGLLGNILSEAARAVGGNKNLVLTGLGALVGALLSGKKAVGGALGGGLMALLGAIAFQALKGRAGQPAKVPLGLMAPQNRAQQKELKRNSEFVLKAMINAAKADGRLDEDEVRRISGNVQEAGAAKKIKKYLAAEIKRPMETGKLVAAAQGQPELAAQLYGASLLAIEVDTPAEKKYMDEFASALGLDSQVTQNIKKALGLQA